MDALYRACQLVEELGAGEVVGGAIDVYSKKKEPVRVPFDAEKINRMLAQKRELADLTVATGETWIGDLTNDELADLFGAGAL